MATYTNIAKNAIDVASNNYHFMDANNHVFMDGNNYLFRAGIASYTNFSKTAAGTFTNTAKN